MAYYNGELIGGSKSRKMIGEHLSKYNLLMEDSGPIYDKHSIAFLEQANKAEDLSEHILCAIRLNKVDYNSFNQIGF